MSDQVLDYIHKLAEENKDFVDENEVLDIYLAVSEDPEVGDPLEFTELYLSSSRNVLENFDELIKMIN